MDNNKLVSFNPTNNNKLVIFKKIDKFQKKIQYLQYYTQSTFGLINQFNSDISRTMQNILHMIDIIVFISNIVFAYRKSKAKPKL